MPSKSSSGVRVHTVPWTCSLGKHFQKQHYVTGFKSLAACLVLHHQVLPQFPEFRLSAGLITPNLQQATQETVNLLSSVLPLQKHRNCQHPSLFCAVSPNSSPLPYVHTSSQASQVNAVPQEGLHILTLQERLRSGLSVIYKNVSFSYQQHQLGFTGKHQFGWAVESSRGSFYSLEQSDCCLQT